MIMIKQVNKGKKNITENDGEKRKKTEKKKKKGGKRRLKPKYHEEYIRIFEAFLRREKEPLG